MVEAGRFGIHKAKPSILKRGGTVFGLVVVGGLVVAAGLAFGLGEPTIVDHVIKRDALAAGAGYLLGVRGVKTDKTRDALVDALESNAGDKAATPAARAAAAYALATTPTHDVAVALAEAAGHDPEPSVRAAACRALGKTGDSTIGFQPLYDALSDSNKQVRMAACDGAGYLKDIHLVDKLITMLVDADYDVRLYATRALQKISGEDYGVDASDWSKWRDRHR